MWTVLQLSSLWTTINSDGAACISELHAASSSLLSLLRLTKQQYEDENVEISMAKTDNCKAFRSANDAHEASHAIRCCNQPQQAFFLQNLTIHNRP